MFKAREWGWAGGCLYKQFHTVGNVCINHWDSSIRKICLLFSLFIDVIIDLLLIYINMNSWIFIFYLDLWTNTIILISLFMCPSSGHWEVLLISSGVSSTGLYSLILNTPLLSCAMTCPRTILHSPCSNPRISHFPRTLSASGQSIFNN